MDKVTTQCPQTTTFLKRKESRSGANRIHRLRFQGFIELFCCCFICLFFFFFWSPVSVYRDRITQCRVRRKMKKSLSCSLSFNQQYLLIPRGENSIYHSGTWTHENSKLPFSAHSGVSECAVRKNKRGEKSCFESEQTIHQ